MPISSARSFLSLGELADLLSVQAWRIARLFELGVLPEPERISGRRMIPKQAVPDVIAALRARGWLSQAGLTVTAGNASEPQITP